MGDHKALETIFGNPFSKASARIERWLLRLQQYDFNVVYTTGSENSFPDNPDVTKPEAKHSRRLRYICNSYTANLVPRARDPLGRGTKGSGIVHLFSPQILEIRYYCACAKFFKIEDMRTEIDTIFKFCGENMKNFLLFFFYIMQFIL